MIGARCLIEIVCCHDNRSAGGAFFLDDFANLTDRYDVQASDRLVEQENVRFLGESLRNEHTLPLATGHFGRVGFREIGDVETFHGAIDRCSIFSTKPAERAALRRAAKRNDLASCHQQMLGGMSGLQDIRDIAACINVAREREDVSNGVKQCRLAGSPNQNYSYFYCGIRRCSECLRAETMENADLQRNLVTSHDALSRFADRYGFTIVDTIIPSVSTSAGASAADLDGVLEAIRTNDVRAVFSKTTESDALAQAISDEIGRDVPVIELFTESLGGPGNGADTYIFMMATNARLIADALS